MNFTSYIEFCCQALEDKAECDSDLVLVALVKLEYIIHPIDSILTKKSVTDGHKAPVAMHINLVRANMERLWNSLPPNIQQNR